MRHIFSSGERLYNENIKELMEGKLIAEHLDYEDIEKDTEFVCYGEISGKNVIVRFVLEQEDIKKVIFKKTLNILMQSDIFHSQWKNYTID